MDASNDNNFHPLDAPREPSGCGGQAVSLDSAFAGLLAPLREALDAIQKRLDTLLEQCAGLLPAPPAPPPENPWKVATQTEDLWEKVFLGEELCADAELGALRRQLVANVVDGVATARALAGELLLVQTAAKDQVPEIFKHVGEAYYHWRPRLPPGCGEDDPLEKALANWLSRHARIMGLPNSIQLVRPGERFDASRHVSSGRGVEITDVHGWVVLRDNNKVYTKAAVSLR